VLRELRAQGLFFDAAIDVARVTVTAPPGTVRTKTVPATLLLDAAGFLVGVDVEPAAASRTVVLLGSHEDVATSVETRVAICTDATGDVFEVRIAGARKAIRADQRSPYVSP
jgi:hypothetical protein